MQAIPSATRLLGDDRQSWEQDMPTVEAMPQAFDVVGQIGAKIVLGADICFMSGNSFR